jgi:hypothetical protein
LSYTDFSQDVYFLRIMKMKKKFRPFYWGFLLATLVSAPTAFAASLASCTVNGDWTYVPMAPKQVCGTYVCCAKRNPKGGFYSFWAGGPSNAATIICGHHSDSIPASSCGEREVDIGSRLTLNRAVRGLAQGNSSAACRYDKPCDGG